jgi:hypothetical protein
MAPAHAVGDKVEAAYRRGDLLQKRFDLMNSWARFVLSAEQPGGNNVVELGRGVLSAHG